MALSAPARSSPRPTGRGPWVRHAEPADLAEVRALHARCSATTLQRRYLTGAGPTETRLVRLLSPIRGGTVVAETPGGQIIAMANLVGEGVQAEVALLVEDRWQHRGLGTALLREVIGLASETGFDAVVIYTGADNDAMLRTLRRLERAGAGIAGRSRTERDGGLVMITVPLDRSVARSAAASG